jgi:nitrogen regulatory protein PII 1
MRMIKAIVRREAADIVADSLAEAGYSSLTKFNVYGRGKQKGISVGAVHYDELPKTMLMMVADDEDVDEILSLISLNTYTGNFGDGKVFVIPVERTLTVRTGSEGL